MNPKVQNQNRQVRPSRQPLDLSRVTFQTEDGGKQRRKYLNFYHCSVVPTKYADADCLDRLGLLGSVHQMLDRVDLSTLCTRNDPTYEPLVLEFLSSFVYECPSDEPDTFGIVRFRMFNLEYSMEHDRLAELLHFTRGENVLYKVHTPEGHWEVLGFSLWQNLTGEATEGWKDLYATRIHNPCIRYFHRILAYTIFGRTNNHKVNQPEMFLLFCSLFDRQINVTPFLLDHIQTCILTKGTTPFIFSGIITSIAIALGLTNELATISHLAMTAQTLDIAYCRGSHLISPRANGKFNLVVNGKKVESVILPCPNRINVRHMTRWRFTLNALASNDDQEQEPEDLPPFYAPPRALENVQPQITMKIIFYAI